SYFFETLPPLLRMCLCIMWITPLSFDLYLFAITRVRCAWCKFQELSNILTTRDASLSIKGKVYKACVKSVLVYGSETLATKDEDMKRLERTQNTDGCVVCS